MSAITVTNSTVYFGGDFGKVGGVFRIHLAAARAADGLLLTAWRPQADDGVVNAMTLTPDQSRVIVGGRFPTLNGVAAVGSDRSTPSRRGSAVGDQHQGAGLRPARGDRPAARPTDQGVRSGKVRQPAKFEGTFAARPGHRRHQVANDCHGDTYDTFPGGQVLYAVSHAHACQRIGGFPHNPRTITTRTAYRPTHRTNTGPYSYGWNYQGVPPSSILTWYPTSPPGRTPGQGQAAWSLAGTAKVTS